MNFDFKCTLTVWFYFKFEDWEDGA